MGAGLHGENGSNPRVSISLWSTYALPRLTYGLDCLTLSKIEIQKLVEVHYVWKNAGFNLMAIKKAGIKAMLMTDTYVLQSNRAKFNQYKIDPTCTTFCGEEPEDQEHFLLRCRSLSDPHDPFTRKSELLSEYLGHEIQQEICKDSNLLVALILDCTNVGLKLRETQRDNFTYQFIGHQGIMLCTAL